jgi:hypothetical protein
MVLRQSYIPLLMRKSSQVKHKEDISYSMQTVLLATACGQMEKARRPEAYFPNLRI